VPELTGNRIEYPYRTPWIPTIPYGTWHRIIDKTECRNDSPDSRTSLRVNILINDPARTVWSGPVRSRDTTARFQNRIPFRVPFASEIFLLDLSLSILGLVRLTIIGFCFLSHSTMSFDLVLSLTDSRKRVSRKLPRGHVDEHAGGILGKRLRALSSRSEKLVVDQLTVDNANPLPAPLAALNVPSGIISPARNNAPDDRRR